MPPAAVAAAALDGVTESFDDEGVVFWGAEAPLPRPFFLLAIVVVVRWRWWSRKRGWELDLLSVVGICSAACSAAADTTRSAAAEIDARRRLVCLLLHKMRTPHDEESWRQPNASNHRETLTVFEIHRNDIDFFGVSRAINSESWVEKYIERGPFQWRVFPAAIKNKRAREERGKAHTI